MAKADTKWEEVLSRLLHLLPEQTAFDWSRQYAAVWRQDRWTGRFVGHGEIDHIGLNDLLHIDRQKQVLADNTEQFLAGLPANNALLWGARGTGKSSLIHALLDAYAGRGLRFVEVRKEDLAALADIVEVLREVPYKFIVFCDDLSFESNEPSYKELKSALEGSIFTTADNVLIYATSNRRHLVPEYASDNQQTRVLDNELHEGEAVEEKISLSDRFGIWLSFYPFKQDVYLDVVGHWTSKLAAQYGVAVDLESEALRTEALQWALSRGVRNGRTAQYFARHWVGRAALEQQSS